MRFTSKLGITALLLAAGIPSVVAQDNTTGATFGTVKNKQGQVLANARVIIDGGRGQFPAVTDAQGQFRYVNLIPGRYTFTVSASGYQTSRGSFMVNLNQRTPLNIWLDTVASEVIEVVSSSAGIDPTTQTTGTNFNSELIATLPIGRSFASVVNLAPGVTGSGIDNNNPSVGGSSGLENTYIIDGVNTTGAGYGSNGSYSINYGSLGTGINNDFIADVQIKSFGLDAEYESSTGGNITAVTKTGSNTFMGSVFAYFDLDSLQARDKVPPQVDPDAILAPRFDSRDRMEFGFTVSGPIIKDKLFYFVGYNPVRTTTKRTQIDPTQPYFNRQGTVKNQTDTYYGKLNYILNANHSLELSFFGDPGKRPYAPQTAGMLRSDETAWQELKFGGANQTIKYNGIFADTWFLEARLSNATNVFEVGINPEVNRFWRITDAITGAFVPPSIGGFLYEQKLDSGNRQMELKVTKVFGDSEIKFGYLNQKITFDSYNLRTGPAGFVDPHIGKAYSNGITVQRRWRLTDPNYTGPIGDANVTPYFRIVRGAISPAARATESTATQYFIQGKWAYDGKLFIKGGFRWHEQDMKGMQQTYKFKAADALAPRFSVSWDPQGDGKNKLYAYYGRYFELIPQDLAVRSLSTEIGTSRSDFGGIAADGLSLVDPIMDGTPVQDVSKSGGNWVKSGNPFTTHYIGTSGFLTPVLPGTKLPYLNEYVLGWDSQPLPGVTVSNRLVHRNLGRAMEDMGIDGGNHLPYYIGNPGQNSHLLADEAKKIDPTLAGSGDTATWVDPVRDYWAYQLEANFRRGKWSGFFNLTLSRTEGNFEGSFRQDNGQSDPNITSMYDFSAEYLRMLEREQGRGLTGDEMFAIGPLPGDRVLAINASGNYTFDFGLSTGMVWRFATGTPLNAYYAGIDYDNSGELPAGGRGNQGRTPSTWTFDWTVNYAMKLGGSKKLEFRADIFNVLNSHKPTSFDQNYEASVNVQNLNYKNVLTYQTARQVRLGVKYSF